MHRRRQCTVDRGETGTAGSLVSAKMGQNQSAKASSKSNYPSRPPPSEQASASQRGEKKRAPAPGDLPRRDRNRAELPTGRSSSVSHPSHPPPSHPPPSHPSPSTRPASSYLPPERSAPLRQFSLSRQSSSSSSSSQASSKLALIERYFKKYCDSGEDAILAEGMEQFCVDLGVDPTEFVVLLLAWKFQASQMCRFTREEFLNGCQKLRAHDPQSLKERFPSLLAEMYRERSFKELYNFTFTFGLDHSAGQRSLPIDMALPLWELVFTQRKPAILDAWFEFLRESDVRGVSRDTWSLFLPFSHSVRYGFSNYDESEAWPSLFDDFVEHELSKAGAM